MHKRVLIFGNGISGNAVAIALRRQGHEVIVVGSPSAPGRGAIGEHLPPEALPLLQGLGIAHLLRDPAHLRSPGIVSFWQAARLTKDYSFSIGGDGYNLDRCVFDEGLRAFADRAGVSRYSTSVKTLERRGDGWVVTTSLAQTIETDFLIDASGRSASLARRLGAQPHFFDSTVAIAGRFLADDRGDARLTIETASNGWWYGTRQTNARRVAVHITDAEHVPAGASARNELWRRRYADTRFVKSLGEPDGAVVEVWDARSMFLSPQAGPGWLSVGDASMAFDPLSAAGITKALADAFALADKELFKRETLDRCLFDREQRWRAYISGLKGTYGEFAAQSAGWWSDRKKWANGLDSSPIARFNSTGVGSEPVDTRGAPHR